MKSFNWLNIVRILLGSCIALAISGCATSARPYTSPYQLTKPAMQVNGNQTSTKPGSARTPNVKSSSSNYYFVKKGDTAYSVSFDNNVEFQTLVKINNLRKPYNLYVGQKLVLNPKYSKVKTYRVVDNDTIYSLSRRFGLTQEQLMSMNGIGHNYRITVGQLLVVGKNSSNTTTVANSNTKPQSSAPAIREQSKQNAVEPAKKKNEVIAETKPKENVVAQKNENRAALANGKIRWQWPYSGQIIAPFSIGEHGNKGIDIGGQRGASVKSAAAGKIVYAGNALRGYGNLIIINHNDDYLSAYAHNDDILVNEGQYVKSGQAIARMGDTEAKSVRLHFEIRYRGESVNPLKYLPNKN